VIYTYNSTLTDKILLHKLHITLAKNKTWAFTDICKWSTETLEDFFKIFAETK